ncbi:hypothetical protein FE391_46905 [Nonomuraea sp. KC401]|uniref:hypothetical protein n=1 Tax=unclassified Nonomuraea TaxID=2593643 RepID=UPI0010FD3083|nr:MULTISPECIES: hypothetical protein [unclassified Nonomuraea]NBF00617.1 hypothetical protein [Nonomuraea sp. K271]TLF45079.1 hypothetical protein FE391_46905 [Nonomuraea sp. KC401]
MGRLEDLAVQYANAARWDLRQALTRIVRLDEEGTLHDKDLGRIAYAYQRLSWWQQVTDLTHGREDTVDGASALLTVRQHAQRLLLHARPVTNGGLFAQAMEESRRGGARAFLDATDKLAQALALPSDLDAPSADHGTPAITTEQGWDQGNRR